jgi:hypothetical protein
VFLTHLSYLAVRQCHAPPGLPFPDRAWPVLPATLLVGTGGSVTLRAMWTVGEAQTQTAWTDRPTSSSQAGKGLANGLISPEEAALVSIVMDCFFGNLRGLAVLCCAVLCCAVLCMTKIVGVCSNHYSTAWPLQRLYYFLHYCIVPFPKRHPSPSHANVIRLPRLAS